MPGNMIEIDAELLAAIEGKTLPEDSEIDVEPLAEMEGKTVSEDKESDNKKDKRDKRVKRVFGDSFSFNGIHVRSYQETIGKNVLLSIILITENGIKTYYEGNRVDLKAGKIMIDNRSLRECEHKKVEVIEAQPKIPASLSLFSPKEDRSPRVFLSLRLSP